jgi:hypothetical protein
MIHFLICWLFLRKRSVISFRTIAVINIFFLKNQSHHRFALEVPGSGFAMDWRSDPFRLDPDPQKTNVDSKHYHEHFISRVYEFNCISGFHAIPKTISVNKGGGV